MADTLLGRLAAVTGGLSDAAVADAVTDAAAQAEEQAILAALLTARRSEYEKDTSLLAAALKRRTRASSTPVAVSAAGGAAVEAGGEIKRALRVAAHAHKLAESPLHYPTNADLTKLVMILAHMAATTTAGTHPGSSTAAGAPLAAAAAVLSLPADLRIAYDTYTAAARIASPKLAPLITAAAFAKLSRDASGRVPLRLLARYLQQQVHLLHAWRRVASYDSECDGRLREHDAENYVFEAVPELPDLMSLRDNFRPFYVFTAVRKFMFVLEAAHQDVVTPSLPIPALVTSRVFGEWLALFPPHHDDMGGVYAFSRATARQAIAAVQRHQNAADASAGDTGAAATPGSSSGSTGSGGDSGDAAATATPPPPPSPPASYQRALVAAAQWLLAKEAGPPPLVPVPIVTLPRLPAIGARGAAAGGTRATDTGADDADADDGEEELAEAVQQLPGGGGTPLPPASNWFTAANAVRVYSTYLELDADTNGLLSPVELSKACGGTLTPAFINRLYGEVNTYGGEMDYKAFLDFTIAVEHRASTASMRYVFTVLDVHKRGYITTEEVRLFLADIAAGMAERGHEAVASGDVCDEVWDMVHPAHPTRITLADLVACKAGHTVLHMLTDVAGFWAYDNRELLLQQQQQVRGGGPGDGSGAGGGGGGGGSDGASDSGASDGSGGGGGGAAAGGGASPPADVLHLDEA